MSGLGGDIPKRKSVLFSSQATVERRQHEDLCTLPMESYRHVLDSGIENHINCNEGVQGFTRSSQRQE